MANKIPRVPVREQDPAIRAANFEEVCYGYDLEEATLEASRCLRCKNPRCVAACPVGIRIPDFIAALHEGRLQEAADIISEDSSLPSICGRVCPQESQCEGSCVLGIKGEPVAVGKLERFVGDWKLEHGAPVQPAAVRNGRKVAVTGRSMENILKVATELDYLHLPENTLVDLNQIKSIPKDKLVIFCVHIPLRNATSFNRETVRNLLKEFDNVHIMAGHTHYAQNYIDGDVYEHIHGAVCGAWWKSTINVDGTPNGYGVYDISGSKIENWYYKPTRLSKDFQIRMYRGETTFAGGYKFTYTASDEIVANIWNSDDRNWKVEVYENGNKTGEMTREKSLDAWGAGYHVGVLSANPDSHGKTTYDHFYHYKLKDAKAAVEIRATDCFGKVYTQNVFTTAAETDYPMVDNYPAVAE